MGTIRVTGHTLTELDELRDHFTLAVETALHAVATTVAAGLSTAVTAAGDPGPDDVHLIMNLWNQQVDETLAPFVAATYESGALAVGFELAYALPLGPGQGIPGVSSDFVTEYMKSATNRLKDIGDDLWATTRSELIAGHLAGESVEQLAVRVQAAAGVTNARALTIARTEIVAASNAGSLAQALIVANDGDQKEWVATHDDRTRPDHIEADGQLRGLSEPFSVGAFALQHPGDSSGPAGETVNCRCTVTYVFNDDPPAKTCDCVDSLTSATHVPKPTTSVNIASGTCICPTLAQPHTHFTGTALTPPAQQQLFDAFKGQGPISPAYGGAKIYKHLQGIKSQLDVFGLDEYQALEIIDHVYLAQGGKSSFEQKFDEWLHSTAGKKTTNDLAKKLDAAKSATHAPTSTHTHAPAPTPTISTPTPTSSPTTAKSTFKSHNPKLDVIDDAGKTAIINEFLAEIGPVTEIGDQLLTGIWKIKKKTPLIYDLKPKDVADLLAEEFGEDIVKIWNELFKGKKASITVKLPGAHVPHAPPTPTSPLPPPPAPIIVKPPLPSTSPAATAPTAASADDISHVSGGDAHKWFQTYKSSKPVTPGWGGSAIYKNLQIAKDAVKGDPVLGSLNDAQLLKLLDQQLAAQGKTGAKTYYGEVVEWAKTPSGKKLAKDLAAGPVTPLSSIPTTTPAPTPTTVPNVGKSGDISGIPTADQTNFFDKFKGKGVYLSSTPDSLYKALQDVKDALNSGHTAGLTDLQALRILDEVGAKKLGVANKNLYEKKIVDWLNTPAGKKAALEANMTPAEKAALAAKKAADEAKKLADIEKQFKIDTSTIPAFNASTPSSSFSVISATDAQAMQDMATPWTATEKSKLRYYTSNNYSAMNGYLRKGGHASAETKAAIAGAQRGMRPSTRPIIVHRGTSFAQFGVSTPEMAQKLVGKTLQDKGFMSTSVGGAAAFGGSVLLEIECPVGTPMAFVKKISHYSSENEMLLAAGLRYRVLSVTKIGSRTTVKVRIVP